MQCIPKLLPDTPPFPLPPLRVPVLFLHTNLALSHSHPLIILLQPDCPVPLAFPLNNHLRNPLSTQRLRPRKVLIPQPCQQIENRRNQQHHCRGEQTARMRQQREPLRQRHDAVHTRTHIVGREAAHEDVEFFRGWADTQEERDFEENKNQAGDARGRAGC